MPYYLPPSVIPSHQIAHADVRQVSIKSPPDVAVRLASAKIPQQVQDELQLFMQSLPELEFSASTITAQAGPLKPGSRPKPKPTDPPPVPPAPLQPVKGQPLNVVADRQEYNTKTQTFTATGNVTILYQKSELKGERVEVNLVTKTAVADGNVFFTRGDQRLRGSRLEYDYGKATGNLANASGSINLGTFDRTEPSMSAADLASGSITLSLGRDVATNNQGKGIRRLGFQADRIILDGDRWQADNLKLTNDPFSPPELEIRTSKATLTPISPTQDRLEAESPTLVFDQTVSIPLPISTLVFDRFQRQVPLLVGYDRQDRGGLFYQQDFDVISQPNLSFQVSPQLFLQRGLENSSNLLDFGLLGVAAKLDSILPDGQYLSGRATLSSLNLVDLQNQLRANLTYSRPILGNHSLIAQYSYRERLYNGSLGFQDVRNSLGVNLFSPNRLLGSSGINFSYQAGAQYIGAERGDLQPGTISSLGRLQGAVALNRGFSLWRGNPLPAEKETGLKYTPEPITPSIDAIVGVSGVYSLYTSGATQGFVSGTVGLAATIGNFSRTFLDYTKINLSYTQGVVAGQSPFLFDRIADQQIFSAGILQQVYGPLRFGIQQTWNPVTGKVIDSSYSLEYSRRTYALVIRYNPTREIGELVLRISDFNWNDPPSDVTTVQGGIERRN